MSSDGLQPTSHGLQPTSDALQASSDGRPLYITFVGSFCDLPFSLYDALRVHPAKLTQTMASNPTFRDAR